MAINMPMLMAVKPTHALTFMARFGVWMNATSAVFAAAHIPRRGARTRRSIRMRRAIGTTLSTEKIAAIATAAKARGSTATTSR
jgi:hypothetical protein